MPDFPTAGREQYLALMLQAGYVEKEGYHADLRSYCCFNCPWMREDDKSVTGYWCSLLGFPDREFACCNHWEPKSTARP